MMVETILDSSQDFGMSGVALPQWKRELLQRRAARSRPPAPPPPPPPPSQPTQPDDDEELRYGPGIVKRLKSRYLSLALRDAPRRRPSVLRRAASLEHLLEPRPPPAPRPATRAPRPTSLAVPAHAQARRDFVKRARSVDALSRLEPRDEPPPSPPPPAVCLPPPSPPPPPPPAPPRPSARPPRRPAPLLRETERPPPDLVRSTLRKFEPTATRRTAPAARVSAALRGLERGPTPEPRSPSPCARTPDRLEEPEATSTPRVVSRAALEGIAKAGCSTRYSFEAPRRASHLPPLAATNPVLVSSRRVGVIRPMPAPPLERAVSAPLPPPEEREEKDAEPAPPLERRPPPSALVEPTPRSPPPPAPRTPPPRDYTPEPIVIKAEPKELSPKPKLKTITNGHVEPPRPVPRTDERVWNGVILKKTTAEAKPTESVTGAVRRLPGAGAKARGGAAPASVVFNFSHRKEVPDYIENDGIILRASRRDRIKAGEPGVVVLRPELVAAQSDSDEDGTDAGPPSPCAVRFVNDNVLINGRSSIATMQTHRERAARLKLQFDDSLTRTFEYPSETSLCEDLGETDAPPAPPATPAPPALAANTHLVSGALGRYTPHKTCADMFQLGVTRQAPAPASENGLCPEKTDLPDAESGGGGSEEDARPCGADAARCWSDARTLATDLLF